MTRGRDHGAPIFVLGITGRSGTNYLRDLIALHPGCEKARSPIWEDFFLSEAHLLLEYVRRVRRRWESWDHAGVGSELVANIGDGLLAFLSEGAEQRIVTKTPSVRNLEHFFELFPSAYLLIIVRDARSVIESAVKSFEADYEAWARDWARAAKRILEFDAAHDNQNSRHRVVRYEDLVTRTREELTGILDFVGLDVNNYDFDAAEHLPTRGSSQLTGEGAMHWQPVERSDDFDPLRRWEHWSQDRHDRVTWILGAYLGALGYDAGPAQAQGGATSQRLRDALMFARIGAKRAAKIFRTPRR